MASLGIRTVIDGKVVRQGLRDITAEIPKIGRRDIYSVFVRARTKLKKPGKRPVYPYPWVSIKQKIAVLYILGSNDNLPYRRSGDYGKAFEIVRLKNGYELDNLMDKASYIGGDAEGNNQTRPFVGRYPVVREVVNDELEKLPSVVVQHIKLVAIEQGFEATTE